MCKKAFIIFSTGEDRKRAERKLLAAALHVESESIVNGARISGYERIVDSGSGFCFHLHHGGTITIEKQAIESVREY